ncbi:MAG: hypothetical protein MRY21_01860 [Simkaniaceae bacterium]|nr:hypothetical protein [Simkaniaceae bacterium]
MKLIRLLVAAALCLSTQGYGGDSRNQFEDDEDVGHFAVLSNSDAIGTSMVGWGIGLGIGIAVLAAVIKPSTQGDSNPGTNHAHAHCD